MENKKSVKMKNFFQFSFYFSGKVLWVKNPEAFSSCTLKALHKKLLTNLIAELLKTFANQENAVCKGK